MKTIIAGSRSIQDYNLVKKACQICGWAITEIVSGGARGVDRMGEIYAQECGVPLTVIEPDWDRYGRSAGAIRNCEMAEQAEALIAIWDGVSPGTKQMIDYATKKGLKVYVHKI